MLPYYLNPKPNPDIYRSDNWVVLDFETSSLEKGNALNADNYMLMAAWYRSVDDTYHYCWGDEFSQDRLLEDIRQSDFIVCHHQKFEAAWLKRCGMDYGERLGFDTLLADYVFAGNRRFPFDLNSCCKRHGLPGKEGLVGSLMKAGVPVESLPKEWVIRYGLMDVKATKDLFLRQREKMLSTGLYKVLFTRCILTPVLAAIEAKGMALDCERVDEAYTDYSERLAEIEERLTELLGELNLSSPQQLAKALYEDLKFKELRKYGKPDRNAASKAFPDGQPKTDMATIQALKPTNKKQREVQELLIEQSKTSAGLTKNLTLFKALCEQKGGIFYGEFKQHSTRTHRLSSTGRKQRLEVNEEVKEAGAQLQNIPRNLKSLFKARDGRLFFEIDFAGLEFRIAGILSNDSQVRQDVIDGVDVHANARDVLNSQGLDVDRTGAKSHSFRPLFSIKVPGKKDNGPSEKYGDWFRERYSGVVEEQQRWLQSAMRDKKVTAKTGLVFYYPYVRMTQSGYINDANKVLNYQIQSFGGAEIMPVGLVYLYWTLHGKGWADIVSTIHDSVEVEADPEHATELAEFAATSLLDRVYDYLEQIYGIKCSTPLGIGLTAGTHWSERGLTLEQRCDIVTKLRDCGYEQAVDDEGEIKVLYA